MDLIFDGRYASEFNLYVCNVTTSAGTEVTSVSELTFDTFRPAGLNKDIFIDATSTNLTMDCPNLKSQARFLIDEEMNNDLLQKYKDICEI